LKLEIRWKAPSRAVPPSVGKRPMLRIKDLKDYLGREVELVVRVVDARQKAVSRGRKYFFLFEDQTGLLEILNLMSNYLER